jgi:hypothetical protein
MQTTVERPIELKPATKQEFIEALRSGKYEQCHGSLYDGGNRRCAIAVYHIISGDPTFDAPVGSRQILGIPITVYAKIFKLNDRGLSFNKIADILEEKLAEDFSRLDG